MTFAEASNLLAQDQASNLDEILHSTLADFFGADFTPQDILQRAELHTFEGEGSTFLVIDGIRVLQWWPPEFTTRQVGGKFIATLTTTYRKLTP